MPQTKTLRNLSLFQSSSKTPGTSSISSRQGIRILFSNGARIVYRLSGTGTEGATLRVYLESYVPPGGDLQQDPQQALGDLIAAIDYSPVAVVGLGYRELDHALDGFGLLTTTRARLPILGVLWDSSIFPDRAPEGGAVREFRSAR